MLSVRAWRRPWIRPVPFPEPEVTRSTRATSTRRSPRPAPRALPTWMCSTRSRGRIWWCCASASGRTRPASGSTSVPARPIAVDPVPRLIDGAEWDGLEAGPAAAGAGAQRLPRRRLRRAADLRRRGRPGAGRWRPPAGTSRRCAACSIPGMPAATVAGLDLVRDAGGELLVLEDNLRMPSGATYALAVREAVAPELGAATRAAGSPTATSGLLGAAIARRGARRRRRAGRRDPLRRPRQRRLLRAPPLRPRAGDPGRHAAPAGAEPRPPLPPPAAASASRSTSSTGASTRTGSATPSGSLTALGELLLPALAVGPAALRQRLRHRRRRRQARPRLRRGDGPLLPRRGAAAALGAELRPRRRDGAGAGAGAARRTGDQAARRLRRRRGDDHAAGDRARSGGGRSAWCGGRRSASSPRSTVPLSTHPTVCGGRAAAAPRRPAALRRQLRRPAPRRWPGGLTRYARGGRRDGRQQLARRRRQGHLGPRPADGGAAGERAAMKQPLARPRATNGR